MTAARSGSVESVTALLAHGAKVSARERRRGQTALMWAVSENHSEVARVLIDHGADFDGRSTSGFTSLLFAARQGHLDSARILLGAGADVNDSTAEGMSLLETLQIVCPYCGENVEVVVDCSIGHQEYIEDCYVCCRPISLKLSMDEEGHPSVEARHENE